MKFPLIVVLLAASLPVSAAQDLLDSYDLALQSDPQLMAQAANQLATAELAEAGAPWRKLYEWLNQGA